jgi:hypothetical protein
MPARYWCRPKNSGISRHRVPGAAAARLVFEPWPCCCCGDKVTAPVLLLLLLLLLLLVVVVVAVSLAAAAAAPAAAAAASRACASSDSCCTRSSSCLLRPLGRLLRSFCCFRTSCASSWERAGPVGTTPLPVLLLLLLLLPVSAGVPAAVMRPSYAVAPTAYFMSASSLCAARSWLCTCSCPCSSRDRQHSSSAAAGKSSLLPSCLAPAAAV